MCIALTVAAVGVVTNNSWLSIALFAMVSVVGLSWEATLRALEAKLKAKRDVLLDMESEGVVFPFLTKEGAAWKKNDERPLQKAAQRAPYAFIVLGALAAIAALCVRLQSLTIA